MPCNSCVPASNSVPALSALESLCLDQVRFWVGVVARNRGRSGRVVDGVPYTRLPAGDLVANLTERFPFLSVTLRQVRRALSRLVALGLVLRQQFWQSERWRSDYFYAVPVPGSSPQVTPVEPLADSREVLQGQPFLKSLPSTHPVQEVLSHGEGQPLASPVDGRGAPVPPAPGSLPSGGAGSKRRGFAALSALKRVVQRAEARGFRAGTGVLQPENPVQTWVEGGFRFTRLASGHLVKDSLACAPLR
jgi:hypothetical protein